MAAKNIRGSDKELIFRARYSTYSAKGKGSKLDSSVTPCFDVPQLQKQILSSIRRICINLMQNFHMFHIAVITVQSSKLPTPKMGAMYHVFQHISVDI